MQETNALARGSAAGRPGQSLREPQESQALPTSRDDPEEVIGIKPSWWPGKGREHNSLSQNYMNPWSSGTSAVCLPGAKGRNHSELSWEQEPGRGLLGDVSVPGARQVWASAQSKHLRGAGTPFPAAPAEGFLGSGGAMGPQSPSLSLREGIDHGHSEGLLGLKSHRRQKCRTA